MTKTVEELELENARLKLELENARMAAEIRNLTGEEALKSVPVAGARPLPRSPGGAPVPIATPPPPVSGPSGPAQGDTVMMTCRSEVLQGGRKCDGTEATLLMNQRTQGGGHHVMYQCLKCKRSWSLTY